MTEMFGLVTREDPQAFIWRHVIGCAGPLSAAASALPQPVRQPFSCV